MNAEELDARLAALPEKPEPHKRPATPAAGLPAPLGATLRLVPPAPLDGAADASRRAAVEARRLRIVAERAALEPRIRRNVLVAIRSTDTPCGLLCGPSRIGKTSAALWMRARFGGMWLRARDLGTAEREHPLGHGACPLREQAREARVLFIDDLGAEESRDVGFLQDLIDHRYANPKGRATFVTTGLTQAELSAYLGAPYVSRLIEQHVRRSDGSEWPVLFFDGHGGSRASI